MRKHTRKKSILILLMTALMTLTLSVRLVGAQDTGVVTYDFTADSYAPSVALTGATVFTGFDAISVYTKSANGSAIISVPVELDSDAKGIAIEYNNLMTNVAPDNLKVTLKSGEDSYDMSEGSKYYELVGEDLKEKAAAAGGVMKATQTAYENFYGYLVLELSEFNLPEEPITIDTIVFTTQLTVPVRYNIGKIYTVTEEGFDEVIYTPSADNFTAEGDVNNYVAQFLAKGQFKFYDATNGDTTDPTWVKFPKEILGVSETEVSNTAGVYEYADLTGFTAIVLEADTTESPVDIRLGMALFSGDSENLYNAQRFQPVEFICVGDNGAVYYLYGKDENNNFINDGRPYMPKGFKGKVYIKLDSLLARTPSNVFNYSYVFPYIKVYAAPVNSVGGTIKISRAYLTNEPINVVSYPIVVTTNASNRGTVTIDKPNVIAGGSATLTVTPKTGYVVDQVLVNGQSVALDQNGQYTITNINARTNITVNIIPDPNAEPRYIFIKSNPHGTITADKNPVPNGADVTFTVEADLGYEVAWFKVNDELVELVDGKYTIPEVETDLVVEMGVNVIYEYEAPMKGTGAVIMDGRQEFGSIYAEFDSIFVSGKFNAPIKDGQAPFVGLQVKNLLVKNFSQKNALVIQYRTLSTSVSTYNECGVKVAMFDSNGNARQAATGKSFYLKEGDLISRGSQISGGMLFTGKPDFSGYLIIPFNAFTSGYEAATSTDALDYTNMESVLVFTDYRWWSDFLSKYFIGDIFIANFDENEMTLSGETLVWTVQGAERNVDYLLYYADPTGSTPAGKTADDYATLDFVRANELLFKDFKPYGFTNTQSNLRIRVDSRMLNKEGFAVWSNIDAIRIAVDNSANDFDIPYSIGVRPWHSTHADDEWIMTGLGGVIFVSEDNSTSYAAEKTTIIPAGFKGYIYIPINEIVFAARNSDADTFPTETQDYIVLYLPVVNDKIKDGSKIILDEILFASENSEIEYTATPFDCDIEYVLYGGVNGDNPTKYNINSQFTLKEATKEGYGFEGWYLNPEFKGRPITEIIPGTHGKLTLYAKFSAYINISIEITGKGSITPNIDRITAGSSQTFVVTPDDGYEIEYVLVNDQPVALNNGIFELTDIQEDVSINIGFKKVATAPAKKKGCKSLIGFETLALLVLAYGASMLKKKF